MASTHGEPHTSAHATALPPHSDLPAAAHLGLVDCQQNNRRPFELLCRRVGGVAGFRGGRTASLFHDTWLHPFVVRADGAIRLHLFVLSASLWRYPASGLGCGLRL